MFFKAKIKDGLEPVYVTSIDFITNQVCLNEDIEGGRVFPLQKTELIVEDHLSPLGVKSLTSGGNTFEELYKQRSLLLITLLNQNPSESWKAKIPKDRNFFLVGIPSPQGFYMVRCHMDFWEAAQLEELDQPPSWYGLVFSSETDLQHLINTNKREG